MFKKLSFPTKICVRGVNGVADFKFEIGFSIFNMADPIWQTYVQKIEFSHENLCSGGLMGSPISNLRSKLTLFLTKCNNLLKIRQNVLLNDAFTQIIHPIKIIHSAESFIHSLSAILDPPC